MLHRNRVLLGALLAVALVSANCVRVEIVGEGKSEAHLVITAKLKFKINPTKDISFPPDFFIPALRGLTLGAGSSFEFEVEPGEITLEDKIVFGGESSQSAKQGELDGKSIWVGGGSLWQPAAVSPAPVQRFTLTGTILPGSTYTWVLPDLFGDANPAVVPVTGTIAAVARGDALLHDPATGQWTLQPGGLLSFHYTVNGPPAVWTLPMQTPFGEFPGEGTVETAGGMLFESSGAASDVQGQGQDGYVDPQGNTWQHGYLGTFPVRLTVAGDVAIGATTVDGGVDLF
jgi:hypothetical protein